MAYKNARAEALKKGRTKEEANEAGKRAYAATE
jgi:hypothetical protein